MKKLSLSLFFMSTSVAIVATSTTIPLIANNQITSREIKSNISENITLFTTNDIHGQLLKNNNDGVAGMKSLNGYLEKNKKDLLIDAGDLTQGTAINDLDYGQTSIEVVKKMGYDALGIGNHEFDFGLEKLKNNVNRANDLFISANIKDKMSKEPLFKGSKIVKLDDYDLNVGIIGLTTPDTISQTKSESVKDVEFSDYIPTIKEEIIKLKNQQANLNFIIVVAHSGLNYSKSIANDLELSKEIDLIIDGHTHETYYEKIGNTHIIQAGSYAKGIRKTVFNFNKDSGLIETFRTDMIDTIILNQYERYSTKEISDLISSSEQKMKEIYDKTIVKNIPFKLEGERAVIRSNETNLGNFISDALYLGATKELNKEVDLALINSGGIRTSINSGMVKKLDVYNTLPHQNLLSIVSAKGSVLKKFILSNRTIISGTLVYQVSKQVKMTINSYSDVVIEILNNQTNQYELIDENKTYTIATIDFITTSETGTNSLFNSNITEGVENIGTYSLCTDYVEDYLLQMDETSWKEYETLLPKSRIIYDNKTSSGDESVLTNSPYDLYFPINKAIYTEENGSNLLMDSYSFKANEVNKEVQAAILYNSSFRNYNSSKYPYLSGDITENDIKNVVSSYATQNYLSIIKVPGLALKQMMENDLNNKLNNKSIVYHYSKELKAVLNANGTNEYKILNSLGEYEEIVDNQLYTIATNNYAITMTSENYHFLNPTKWMELNKEWCENNVNSLPTKIESYESYNDLSLFVAKLKYLKTNEDWEIYKEKYPNQRLVI